MVVLVRPRPSTDYLGIGLALLAAVCWGCYILLNRTVGRPAARRWRARPPPRRVSGAALPARRRRASCGSTRPPPAALRCALAAGVLSSAVPFLADLLALRRVPAHFFGDRS